MLGCTCRTLGRVVHAECVLLGYEKFHCLQDLRLAWPFYPNNCPWMGQLVAPEGSLFRVYRPSRRLINLAQDATIEGCQSQGSEQAAGWWPACFLPPHGVSVGYCRNRTR